MLKVNHKALILLSGAVWMIAGCGLLYLGLHLMIDGLQARAEVPLLSSLGPFLGGIEQVALFLIVFGLFIGYMKGRYVLGRAAKKGIHRIRTLPEPADISSIYSKQYYLLLGAMVLLGMSIKWLGLPNDVRGFVDVAIGSALINGAMCYFRECYL